jgi:uncharacterized membrane protein YidH (DUF202 family)
MNRLRPATSFDAGLQHERTALAWERTAISTMVAGALLGRWAAQDAAPLFGVFGIVQVAFGGALLAWAGRHYEDLHGPLRSGVNPTHPRAVYVVGVATTVGIGAALALAGVLVFRG